MTAVVSIIGVECGAGVLRLLLRGSVSRRRVLVGAARLGVARVSLLLTVVRLVVGVGALLVVLIVVAHPSSAIEGLDAALSATARVHAAVSRKRWLAIVI